MNPKMDVLQKKDQKDRNQLRLLLFAQRDYNQIKNVLSESFIKAFRKSMKSYLTANVLDWVF